MAIGYDRFDSPPILVPARATTSVEDFAHWATSKDFPAGVRITYCDHELIIEMSPEEIETHNKVKLELTIVLAQLVRALDLGEFYTDGVLLTNVDVALSAEPDGFFASWPSIETGRVVKQARLGEAEQFIEVRGTPDMVFEIVSKYSVKKDSKTLFDFYHRAGIREYWLIDARGDEIEFRIFVHQPERYSTTSPVDAWLRSDVFRHDFRLSRNRDRIGGWSYTLNSKPIA